MNKTGSFEVMWMNVEPVIQSEISQKEKNKCPILTHIYIKSRKMLLMNVFAGQEQTHTKKTCGHGALSGKDKLRE